VLFFVAAIQQVKRQPQDAQAAAAFSSNAL
jgi:hypothetical protein